LLKTIPIPTLKSEMFKPKLIDRSVYANWKAAGSKTLEVRVNEKVKEILANYRPKPVPSQKLAMIEDYMRALKK